MSPFQLMCNKEKEINGLACSFKDVVSFPEKVSPLLKTFTKFKEPDTNESGFKHTAVSKSQSSSKQPLKSILKKLDSNVERKGRVTFNLNLHIRYIPNRCRSANARPPNSNVNGYNMGTKKVQQARNSNNISKGSNCQDVNINSRIFRPQRNFNGMARQTVDRKNNYVQESRPRYIETCHGYVNSYNKPNYSKPFHSDTFVFKIEKIPNNVRVRDLKAALVDHGVKPLYITWKGPRGFAYLHYSNSNGFNKDHVVGSLNKIRFKTNGVETFQLQTLIVTESQLF
ncbi:Hypothetical protein CINCED_3A002700 [Cinara cedri]|uniref:Uncharacterized protein n=1 Tax=Cinara cedri TaxID=506608 RepID=A0A5E4M6F3_9HEMI|nr:Hypothetical protein CINCED_3A002700 [Cinara cedri]